MHGNTINEKYLDSNILKMLFLLHISWIRQSTQKQTYVIAVYCVYNQLG